MGERPLKISSHSKKMMQSGLSISRLKWTSILQARFLSVRSELSPNPEATVFWVEKGREILGRGAKSLSFENRYSCADSPLAAALFKINGIEAVMLGPESVTVKKRKEFEWQVVTPSVELVLSQFIDSGIPVVRPGVVEKVDDKPAEGSAVEEQSLEARIRNLIKERVQPFVAQDGGDVDFVSFDEDSGVVKVRMHGSCKGCPKSSITLKHGIERMLKHYIPDVVGVIDVGASETLATDEDTKVFGP
jgi:Fe-S cluster biogenesis protein NfuA